MIEKININGVEYHVTPVAEGATPTGVTVKVDGVVYQLGDPVVATAAEPAAANTEGTIEKISVNGIVYDIADVEAVAAERERAEAVEISLSNSISAVLESLGVVKDDAARVDGNAFSSTANEMRLTTTGVNIAKSHTVVLPAATTENAGVMSAEDKALLNRAVLSFDVLPDRDSVDVACENAETESTGVYPTFEIPAATTKNAGVLSAVDKEKIETIKFVDSDDMIEAVVDQNNKLLESRDIEGNKIIHTSLEVKNIFRGKNLNGETISIGEAEQAYTIEDAQFILVELDSEEKIHHAVNTQGIHMFPAGIVYPQATDIYKGVVINAIGDSLSNGFTYLYGCRDILGMKIGGTMIGGTAISGSNSNAFWQNSRVNALSEDAKIIIIQGGTNDWSQVGEISVTNYDTNTLCGAFNVMISKIYYRYLNKKKAYYDIDYSGISLVSKPVSQLPIFVILPPPCPGTDREAAAKKNAEALEKISLMWGLDIIDGRRIGFNYIHGAAADMVHAARNLFNILDAKLVSKLKSLATGMSFLTEPTKEIYSITVLNDVHGVKTDDYAAVGDDVYISFDSLPNSVEIRDSSGNIVDCVSIDTLTNIAYKFAMPNYNVIISIN